MLLTQPYYRHCVIKGLEPLCSHSRHAMLTCYDSACRVLSLIPEPPRIADLLLLPRWWCSIPYIYLAADIIVDEASHNFASINFSLGEDHQHLSLALQWLNTLSCFRKEASGSNSELIYKLSSTAASPFVMEQLDVSRVRRNQPRANEEEGSFLATVYSPQDLAGPGRCVVLCPKRHL